jgi:hypothetical protein
MCVLSAARSQAAALGLVLRARRRRPWRRRKAERIWCSPPAGRFCVLGVRGLPVGSSAAAAMPNGRRARIRLSLTCRGVLLVVLTHMPALAQRRRLVPAPGDTVDTRRVAFRWRCRKSEWGACRRCDAGDSGGVRAVACASGRDHELPAAWACDTAVPVEFCGASGVRVARRAAIQCCFALTGACTTARCGWIDAAVVRACSARKPGG